jgi:glycosyltransferase involved in cell wall biosynthesis
MLISILIPTLLERQDVFNKLVAGLYKQINDNKLEEKVEVISICDNRTLPLSVKRNTLQKLATGKYFCHLDDDDCFRDDYCKVLVNFIENNINTQYKDGNLPDIIAYDQICYVKEDIFVVKPSMNCDFRLQPAPAHMPSEKKYPEYMRYPWQWQLWNTERFSKVYRSEADTRAREDVNWLKRVTLEYPQSMGYVRDYIAHEYHFEDPSKSTCQ